MIAGWLHLIRVQLQLIPAQMKL